MSSRRALAYIRKEKNPRIVALLINRLYESDDGPFPSSDCVPLLEELVNSSDEDTARYAIGALISDWPWSSTLQWKPSKTANRSVKLMMKALGLRSRAPAKKGVLALFFKDRMGIGIQIPWRRALAKDLRDAERRCLRLQKLMSRDPGARILMLDTFNEVMIQNFSRKHTAVVAAYKAAARTKAQPDFGNWLFNAHFALLLPKGITWFRDVHKLRVEADLAHAKGKKTGRPTRAVSYKRADAVMRKAQVPWAELIKEWKTLLT
jgi:hypothetical protein